VIVTALRFLIPGGNFYLKNRWGGRFYNTSYPKEAKRFKDVGEIHAYLQKYPELRKKYEIVDIYVCLEHTHCNCSAPKKPKQEKIEKPVEPSKIVKRAPLDPAEPLFTDNRCELLQAPFWSR